MNIKLIKARFCIVGKRVEPNYMAKYLNFVNYLAKTDSSLSSEEQAHFKAMAYFSNENKDDESYKPLEETSISTEIAHVAHWGIGNGELLTVGSFIRRNGWCSSEDTTFSAFDVSPSYCSFNSDAAISDGIRIAQSVYIRRQTHPEEWYDDENNSSMLLQMAERHLCDGYIEFERYDSKDFAYGCEYPFCNLYKKDCVGGSFERDGLVMFDDNDNPHYMNKYDIRYPEDSIELL